VVVLTTYADESSIPDALHAGALGYLTTYAGIAEISRAVQAAAAGHSLLDATVQSRLLAAASAGVRPAPAPAAHLVVSEATIKTHINHLFAKAGVRDRAQAVHYAYTHGLAE
jgi:DNA-binding NarL/FixJ family response regulator